MHGCPRVSSGPVVYWFIGRTPSGMTVVSYVSPPEGAGPGRQVGPSVLRPKVGGGVGLGGRGGRGSGAEDMSRVTFLNCFCMYVLCFRG